MEKYVYKGKNKEEIINHALQELELNIDDVFVKEKEEKGSLFSGKKVILEIVKKNEVADFGKSILENLLKGFNIEGQIEKKIRDNGIMYTIHSNNNAILIGKNGKILDSIQKYVKQALNNKVELFVNVIIDIENYKEKQNFYLERDVKKLARQVTLSKGEIKLDPMNSYQRRIVHNALSKFEYISSESVGEEPNRYIVIKYVEKDNK